MSISRWAVEMTFIGIFAKSQEALHDATLHAYAASPQLADSIAENLKVLTLLDPHMLHNTICRVQLLLPPSIQINHDSMQSTRRDPSQDRFSRTLDGERTGAPATDASSQWADPTPWEGSMNYTCPFPAPAEPIDPTQSLSGRSSGDATPAPGAALVDDASDLVDWSSWIEHNFLHPGDTPPDAFWNQPAVTLHVVRNVLPKDNYANVFIYVESLKKQEEMNFIKIRLARTLLYLLYIEELEETKRRRGGGMKERGRVETEAIDTLLGAISGGILIALDPSCVFPYCTVLSTIISILLKSTPL
ncbi:hypothetical protein AJ80_04026 [Polytolypa hystricis UAMH7299]|uniref:Uncharacterized protein n=1 Tax=Polytolypa hystricis (strain UAMH7299) TaxID=1447883 RepID=A0A2B7YE07_POLH7|nr:hypothetical protein AJ80_04026 [Polytolypa hystricis UAMH7299]